jgi:hypothetical protein
LQFRNGFQVAFLHPAKPALKVKNVRFVGFMYRARETRFSIHGQQRHSLHIGDTDQGISIRAGSLTTKFSQHVQQRYGRIQAPNPIMSLWVAERTIGDFGD